jgi:putative transposase
VRRAIRLQLKPSREQVGLLEETTWQFTATFNAVCAYGWEHRTRNGVTLHHATYYGLKLQYPALVSDLHIQARVKATEAVKSALTLAKDERRKVSCPVSAACPPRFNVHTMSVHWADSTVRLSTTGGRTTIRFGLPHHAHRYLSGKVAMAELVNRDGAWWLHVVMTLPTPEIAPTDAVVGVDLGLAQPAVTSNNCFLGKKAWRAIEARIFNQQRALQRRGTASAKRRLKITRRRQARFRRDCDHVLSKQIVEATPPGGTVVLEKLTNIRKRVTTGRKSRLARRIHGWSFARIKIFVEYKAEGRGVTVAGVDPRHTSQRCPNCGHTARNNRRSRAWFHCRHCGFQLHADLVGARNIAAKYLVGSSSAVPGGPTVMRPIVGSVDVGDRIPAEVTHKLPAYAGSSWLGNHVLRE